MRLGLRVIQVPCIRDAAHEVVVVENGAIELAVHEPGRQGVVLGGEEQRPPERGLGEAIVGGE